MDTPDNSPSSRSNCAAFWGPFRPFFGHHTSEEASTSAFFPTLIVAFWRLTFSLLLLATVLAYLITGTYQLQFYSAWSHIGLGLAFLFTATSSFLHVFQKTSPLPSFAVPIFQLFASAGLFLDVVFWSILFDYNDKVTFATLIQHVLNLGFVILDLILSCRMQFRLIYTLLCPAFTLVFLAFAWVRYAITDDWVYNFLDYERKGVGIVILYYLGMLLWAAVASLLLFLLSRLSRCFKTEDALDGDILEEGTDGGPEDDNKDDARV